MLKKTEKKIGRHRIDKGLTVKRPQKFILEVTRLKGFVSRTSHVEYGKTDLKYFISYREFIDSTKNRTASQLYGNIMYIWRDRLGIEPS